VSFEWGKIVKSINWTLVFNLVNFGVLLYVLRRLLFKPALEYLDRRREQIAGRMAEARESEAKAAALVAERETEYERAREQSARMIEEARQRAEAMVDDAKGQARVEAERIISETQRRMEQDRDRMIDDLKAAYAEIAVLGAERVLDREVKIADHRRLLDQLLAEIDEETLKVGS